LYVIQSLAVDLVNTTPLAAALNVASLAGRAERRGLLTVKATFRLGARGAELDTKDPLPILARDEPTALGLLPRDDVPRRDGRCEVLLLAAAHAPAQAPVQRMTVSLSIGAARRELLVTGDREWAGEGPSAVPGAPEPFRRMPLVWERAFGGTASVLVDEDSPLDFVDPRNPYGKGFDAAGPARELCREWRAPPPYPVLPPARLLPNIEDPAAPVTRWDDAPEPCCWATAPAGVDLHLLRAARSFDRERPPPIEEVTAPRVSYRAHPDLVLDIPPPGTRVLALGVRPLGEPFDFALPDLRVHADYVVGSYRGRRALKLETLVLLPEEGRFYMVLRHAFTVPYRAGEERAMRLVAEIGRGGQPS
jgi:hypothetical protein